MPSNLSASRAAGNSGGFRRGLYTPINPDKYIGNVKDIWFMSSWELDVCKFLDTNPKIIRWGSEIVAIPYFKRSSGKIHKYYIDFYVKFVDREGKINEELWEIKPLAQTKAPRKTKRKKTTTLLHEQKAYETNLDKWKAAQEFCKKKGIKFRLLTEKDIFC